MKTSHLPKLITTAALAAAFTITSAHSQTTTPDSVETRIGTLKFEKGYPTEETARKLFDDMDYQRAVQAYLWAYPAVSFESIRIGVKRDLGADLNDLVIADNYADPKCVWLTANDTTIYALANIDLGKSGPLVVEIPPGAIVCMTTRPDRKSRPTSNTQASAARRKASSSTPDKSVDVFFGPTAPAGHEANWIQTIPGKGWNPMLRLYGPLEPWFDKTWRPGEIELVK